MLKPRMLAGFFLFFTVVAASAQPMNRKIADDVISSLAKINTLKYRMIKKERIKGVMKTGEIQAKYQKSPFNIYIYVYSPKPGVEVLYVTGENGGKAYVNPNSFFLNVLDPDLDPKGKTLRKDEHHSVFESGFEFTRNLLIAMRKRADSEGRFDEYCQYAGDIKWDGRDCYKMILQYPDYKWESYTVKAGEDIDDIAESRNLYGYTILEKNKLSWFTSVKAGQVIQIPNIYAKKVVLYIDKLHKVPIYQEVHDDIGLLSIYEYHSLLINPVIPKEEFTKGYKDYNF